MTDQIRLSSHLLTVLSEISQDVDTGGLTRRSADLEKLLKTLHECYKDRPTAGPAISGHDILSLPIPILQC